MLLTSRAGIRIGRRLAVVEYVGRRTGRRHRLVVLYRVQGRTVRINVGMAKHKTWWRNFETRHPIHLRLAGVDHRGIGHLVRDGHRVIVVADLEHAADGHDDRASSKHRG